MPIPTEPVGSLPRPMKLQAAYAGYDTGKVTKEQLTREQDAACLDSIKRMEATGAPVVSDGEQRISSFATYPIADTLAGTGLAEHLAPDGQYFAIFTDGHHRQLPRLTGGPFKYKTYAAEFTEKAVKMASKPLKQAVIAPSMLALLYPLDGELKGYSRDQFLNDLCNECEKDIRMAFKAGAKRVSLEEAFAEIMGKPMAQIILEGQVADEVWAELISHLSEFQIDHPGYSDVHLRGIQQGFSASVLYLEADHEISLAAYLAEMADIIGNGSLELFEKLGATIPNGLAGFDEAGVPVGVLQDGTQALCVSEGRLPSQAGHQSIDLESPPTLRSKTLNRNRSRTEALQRTDFWRCEKAFAILTGDRQVWFEATSNDQLTLRPPHGITSGIDIIRGHFVSTNGASGPSYTAIPLKQEE